MGRYNRSTGKYNHSTSKYTVSLPSYNKDPKYKPDIIIKPEKKVSKKQVSSDFAKLAEKLEVTPDDWNSVQLPEVHVFDELTQIEDFVSDSADFEVLQVNQVEPLDKPAEKNLNDMFIENLVSLEHVPEKPYELPKKKVDKLASYQDKKSYQEQTSVYDEETINHILEHDLDKIVTTEPKKRNFSPPKYDPTEDEFDLEKLKPFAGVIVFILFILFRGCS